MALPADAPPMAIPAALWYAAAPQAYGVFFPTIDMRRTTALIDVGIAVVVIAIFMPLLIEFGVLLSLESATPLGPLFANVPIGLFFLVFVVSMLIFRKQSFKHVGLTIPSTERFWVLLPISLPGIYAAAMAGAMIYMLFALLVGGSGGETEMVEDKLALFDMLPQVPPWLLVPFVLFVGVHEELLFRGFLLSRLRTATGSNVAAVIITSILFGFMHMYQGPIGVVQTASIGVALAIITIYARTIWPAIIAHAFLDGVNISLMPLLQKFLTQYAQQISASQPAVMG